MISAPPPSAAGFRWYAVHTLPRQEALAVIHLERQGYEAFLPKALVTRRHARKFETLKAALFPRYAFVSLDIGRHRWRSINGTMGVASLVMGIDYPQPVPNGIVEDLIEAADEDGVIDIGRGFRPGDPVEILVGPFAGTVGTLVSLDAKGRVEMLLSLLTGAVRVKVAREVLRPAS
ncbi:transcriptional activator RfaH [Siculibacillus lacustris]|uniref:Transcriptional activator RfaH n=1 Tax=Siculibacillus lacustris TaxID=1549641 RepID=A0A4Q9VED1_9HYPH|nr:transcriptional activator RfaH [Siculibacillus lacustris]TBW32116.1 transcriptional activator RfaH [Siculibacillus lacustris]